MSDQSAPAAWIGEALDRFEGPLLRYAIRLTGEADRARDVVQDVFLALCRQDPAQLDGRLAPWLYRVCRNRVIELHRQGLRMTTMALMQEPVAGMAAAADPGGLPGLLAGLPARQQEVLRLKFQAGLSYRQIADVTGLSIGNVGLLIHTAITALRTRGRHAHECR
jgi:RNA polymerase sigma-70 factor (ECF subfamily)